MPAKFTLSAMPNRINNEIGKDKKKIEKWHKGNKGENIMI